MLVKGVPDMRRPLGLLIHVLSYFGWKVLFQYHQMIEVASLQNRNVLKNPEIFPVRVSKLFSDEDHAIRN